MLPGRLNAQRAVFNPSMQKRAFSGCFRWEARWGFIGLGAMGYPMARNLRAKIPETDELFVCDRNTAAATSFLSEAPNAAVQVSRTPREVAERADIVITVLPEPHHVKLLYH